MISLFCKYSQFNVSLPFLSERSDERTKTAVDGRSLTAYRDDKLSRYYPSPSGVGFYLLQLISNVV